MRPKVAPATLVEQLVLQLPLRKMPFTWTALVRKCATPMQHWQPRNSKFKIIELKFLANFVKKGQQMDEYFPFWLLLFRLDCQFPAKAG